MIKFSELIFDHLRQVVICATSQLNKVTIADAFAPGATGEQAGMDQANIAHITQLILFTLPGREQAFDVVQGEDFTSDIGLIEKTHQRKHQVALQFFIKVNFGSVFGFTNQ